MKAAGIPSKPTTGRSQKSRKRCRDRIEKAAVAAAGGDEELAAEEAHDIFVGDIKNDDFIAKVNAETRKHELSSDTKEARAETVCYYTGYNTVRQRTKQRKIGNYENHITKSKSGLPRLEIGVRIKDKYGILRSAPRSAYKVRGGKEWMFNRIREAWTMDMTSFKEEHIHSGDQHVMVPVVNAVQFYLFNLVNHPLFEGTSMIFRAETTYINIDMMVLFDSKTIKNVKEGSKRATLIVGKFPAILSQNTELSVCSMSQHNN